MTTIRTALLFAGAVLIGASAAGCGHAPPPAKPSASSPVIVIFDVVGAKPLAATGLTVTAVDRPGQSHAPFTSGQVSLSMPGMSMPPNVVPLKAVSPGRFTGTGTFTMAGKWVASVHLTMQDGKTVDQDFPVSL
jgi:hypothetical protein